MLDELELEFDEPFEDELDELLPATIIEPSLLAVLALLTSEAGAEYCFASAVPVASAATPAISADLSFQGLIIAVTPVFRTCMRSCGVTGCRKVYSYPMTNAR